MIIFDIFSRNMPRAGRITGSDLGLTPLYSSVSRLIAYLTSRQLLEISCFSYVASVAKGVA